MQQQQPVEKFFLIGDGPLEQKRRAWVSTTTLMRGRVETLKILYHDVRKTNNRSMKMTALLGACLLLMGCSHVSIQKYQQIDHSDKSITVPTGGAGLTGKLKQALATKGWKTSVASGPTITEGRTGEKTLLKTYDTSVTRYSLRTEWSQYDYRIPDFDPMYHFDISVLDNKTGAEVLTASGSHSGKVIASRFIKALEE